MMNRRNVLRYPGASKPLAPWLGTQPRTTSLPGQTVKVRIKPLLWAMLEYGTSGWTEICIGTAEQLEAFYGKTVFERAQR